MAPRWRNKGGMITKLVRAPVLRLDQPLLNQAFATVPLLLFPKCFPLPDRA
jgi:hypothetical protein